MRKTIIFILAGGFVAAMWLPYFTKANSDAAATKLQNYSDSNLSKWLDNLNREIDRIVKSKTNFGLWTIKRKENGKLFYERHDEIYNRLTHKQGDLPVPNGPVPEEVKKFYDVEQNILRKGARNTFWLCYLRIESSLANAISKDYAEFARNDVINEVNKCSQSFTGWGDKNIGLNILNTAISNSSQDPEIAAENFIKNTQQKIGQTSNPAQLKQCLKNLTQTQKQGAVKNYKERIANLYSELLADHNKKNIQNKLVSATQNLDNLWDKLQIAGSLKEAGVKINEFFENPSLEKCDKAASATNIAADTAIEANQQLEQAISIIFTLTPGLIEVTTSVEKIAVFPPGLFGEQASESGYAKITPLGVVNAIKDYLFKISNVLFILLVVIGGIFYIFIGFKADYKQEADRWIGSAIKGYIILLVASAIISALKFLFDSK